MKSESWLEPGRDKVLALLSKGLDVLELSLGSAGQGLDLRPVFQAFPVLQTFAD